MKIKIIKNVDEISAMAGGIMVGAPHEETLEELLAAFTVGSIGPKDDERVRQGQEERERQKGCKANRAVVDLEESPVEFFTNPEVGNPYAVDTHNPSDENWQKFLMAKARRQGNRAIYPGMNLEGEYLQENKSFEDLDTMDMDIDSVDREFFDDNPEPLDVDDSTDDEKFKKWVNQQLENMDLTIGDYLGGGMFGEVYKTDYGVIKIVGVPKSLRASRAKEKNYRPIEDEDVEREISNYSVVSDAREQDEDIMMHFPEVYGSQVIPYEDGSKIGFIHMEELTPLTSDQTMSVADPAQAVGKMKNDGVFPVRSIVPSYDKDLSKRYIGFLTSEENEKLLKRYVDENSNIYSQVRPEIIQDILKNYDTTKGAALRRIKDIKEKIAELNPDNQFTRRTVNQSIKAIEIDSKDNHSLMLVFIEMLLAVVVSAKESGLEKSKINRRIEDYTMKWLSDARSYTMMDTKFSKIDDMAADMGLDSLVGRPNARGIIKAIKKLKDLTGLRAVDMHSENIMARHGQNLVIVDLGLFRKDNKLQESRNFRIKIKRNPAK